MTATRIVILDNDSHSLGAMYTLLLPEGYRIFRCRPQDLADARAVVRQAGAALVILDRWLAKVGDGWEFLKGICSDRDTANLPAIIACEQTALLPRQEEILRMMQCHVLRKPFDAQELLRAIAALGPAAVRSHGDAAVHTAPDGATSLAEAPNRFGLPT